MGYNGLNGTILLNTGNDGIMVGTVPGDDYGYPGRDLRVTVDIRIERAERQETYETINHDHVSRPLDFAMTTNVWRPDLRDIVQGGATRDPIREVATTGKPADGWDALTLTRLADIGDRWHLNGMNAGCAHQDVVWEDEPYRRPSLELTPACPMTGYRYGHAWLHEVMPDDVVEDVLHLLAGPIDNLRCYVHPDLSTAHEDARKRLLGDRA